MIAMTTSNSINVKAGVRDSLELGNGLFMYGFRLRGPFHAVMWHELATAASVIRRERSIGKAVQLQRSGEDATRNLGGPSSAVSLPLTRPAATLSPAPSGGEIWVRGCSGVQGSKRELLLGEFSPSGSGRIVVSDSTIGSAPWLRPRKRASPKGRPFDTAPLESNYGVFSMKKRAGSLVLMGMALENDPPASKKPVRFVVQLASGAATSVEVSHE